MATPEEGVSFPISSNLFGACPSAFCKFKVRETRNARNRRNVQQPVRFTERLLCLCHTASLSAMHDRVVPLPLFRFPSMNAVGAHAHVGT